MYHVAQTPWSSIKNKGLPHFKGLSDPQRDGAFLKNLSMNHRMTTGCGLGAVPRPGWCGSTNTGEAAGAPCLAHMVSPPKGKKNPLLNRLLNGWEIEPATSNTASQDKYSMTLEFL